MATDQPDYTHSVAEDPLATDQPDHTQVVAVTSGGGAVAATKLVNAGQVTVSDNTWTVIDVWDEGAPGFDDIGAFAPANPDRLTIPSTGRYLLAYNVGFTGSGDYNAEAALTINSTDPANDGVMIFAHHSAAAISFFEKSLVAVEAWALTAGDVLRLYLIQRAGVDKSTHPLQFTLLQL